MIPHIEDSELSRIAEQRFKEDCALSDALAEMHRAPMRAKIKRDAEDLAAWTRQAMQEVFGEQR